MSRQTRSAARREQTAAGGAWHELPEDLVCRIAALLPIRERCERVSSLLPCKQAVCVVWPRAGTCCALPLLFLAHATCRYGVLPQLNRHYHAASLRWPIGDGMGITQLFLPTGRLSSQVGRPWPQHSTAGMAARGHVVHLRRVGFA